MLAENRIRPSVMEDALAPVGARAAKEQEEAQYDAILAAYARFASDPEGNAIWAAQNLISIMHALANPAALTLEATRNCILLILALSSPGKDPEDATGTDVVELNPPLRTEVCETLQDLFGL